jgi:hypothetical protein
MSNSLHYMNHQLCERQARNAEALDILLRVQEKGAANDNTRSRDNTATLIIVLAWATCIYLGYSFADTALEPVFSWALGALGWGQS